MSDGVEPAMADEGGVRNEVSHSFVPGVLVQGRDVKFFDGGSHFHVWSGQEPVRDGAWQDCPYLGLAPFLARHARVFYGRGALVERLVKRLVERLPQGVLVVVGASGAGKSSLLQAGLLPRLALDELGLGSGRWPVLNMTPTGRPLRELANKLADLAGLAAPLVYRSLREDPQAAPQLIEQALRATRTGPGTGPAVGIDAKPGAGSDTGTDPGGNGPAPRLLLVVDQLEELFTLAQEGKQGREERAAFFTALRAATTPTEPGGAPAVMLVAAVRGDFLDQALRFPLLAEAVDADVFAITPMSEADLRAAVTGPAAEAGVRVEEAVVDAVVAEVRSGDPATEGFGVGVLPLVSQAMYAAWERREPGGGLDLRAYRRGGGTTDAVNHSAQTLYDELPSERQTIAATVFTLLTIVSPDGRPARRRLSTEQLHAACTADPAEVNAVITAFTARRLLVTHDTGVEIAHDVLLTSWHQLNAWLRDDRLDRALHSRLLTDTTTWLDHGRNRAYLYPAARLAEAKTAADRWKADAERYPQPTADATEFLQAGHRRSRIRRTALATLAVLTAIAITLTLIVLQDAAESAQNSAAEAIEQHAVALSRQLAAESLNISTRQPVTARRLAAAAWHASHTDQARDAMTQLVEEQQQNGMLPASPGRVNGVAFSPDGNLLATANIDGSIGLWDPDTAARRRQLSATDFHPDDGVDGGVRAVAFSPAPERPLLAAANNDGTIGLWDPETGQHLKQLPSTGGVNRVVFGNGGRLLAAANNDGTIGLWDPETGQHLKQLPALETESSQGIKRTVNGVAVSPKPDVHLLAATYNDGTLMLWNTDTGASERLRLPRSIEGSQRGGVAFGPDGHTIAALDRSGHVWLWNANTRNNPNPLPDHGRGLSDGFEVAFSPDGQRVAATYRDGSVEVWDAENLKYLHQLPTTHPNPPDGSDVAVRGVAFSPDPDGHLLAATDSDGAVRLWVADTGRPVGRSIPTGSGVTGVAPSPDGRLVATTDYSGNLRLWNTGTGQLVRELPGRHTPYGVVFSPDGHLLATSSSYGAVELWNTDGKNLRRLGEEKNLRLFRTVAFSPADDKHMLAATSNNGTVHLWNPDTGKYLRQLPPRPADSSIPANPGDSAFGVAFSPDGHLLAATYPDGSVGLWNPDTGDHLRQLPAYPAGRARPVNPDDSVYGVAFSPAPDAHLLAATNRDGTIGLWNTDTGQPTGIRLPPNTDASVSRMAFSPDGKLLATTHYDGTVQLWDPNTGRLTAAPLNAASNLRVLGVAFSRDGSVLATANDIGTVYVAKMRLFTDMYTELCKDVGAPTSVEWKKYADGEPPTDACQS